MNAELRRLLKTKEDIAGARSILNTMEKELNGIKDRVKIGSMIKVAGIRDIYYPVLEKGSNHVVIDVGSSKMKVIMNNIIGIKKED